MSVTLSVEVLHERLVPGTSSLRVIQNLAIRTAALHDHVANLEAEADDFDRQTQELAQSMRIVSGAQFPSQRDLEYVETAQKQSLELRRRCKEAREAFLILIRDVAALNGKALTQRLDDLD
ncbi:hypothetical protein K438DRAFT_1990668 [Mycena galopus ATCC 62051]|nr:hypothetical protein K438DRAFT_1990668 [Mycena galopus ATCC 62051]